MFGEAKQVVSAALEKIAADGFEKAERILISPQGVSVRVSDQQPSVLNFCANNYLGLSNDARVVDAARKGLDERGFGLSSVRFICGTQDEHKRLEGRLSSFLGMDDAILYSSCFDANAGLFETLLDERDAIVSDSLNHASIIDGIRLCRADRHRYPHGDMAALERALIEAQGKRLRMIATDGVFSMDGDFAQLDRICDLADAHRALVMVDDSHATGFVGRTGRGTPEHFGVMGRVDVLTSTFGKALGGASGGFTAARHEIVALLRQRSRPYLFSNALAPPIVAASLRVVELLSQSTDLRDRLMQNALRFRDGVTRVGLRIKPGVHPIVPVMMTGPKSADEGDARLARDVASALLVEGIYVVGFWYPVVPKGEARIRVQLSAAHTDAMIDEAVAAFGRVGRRFGLV